MLELRIDFHDSYYRLDLNHIYISKYFLKNCMLTKVATVLWVVFKHE